MTELDTKVLDDVREQIAALGYPSTIKGLAGRLGVSGAAICKSYGRLEAAGLLRRRPGVTRGVEVIDVVDLRTVPTDALEIELGRRGVTFRALSRVEPLQPRRGAPCAATVCDRHVQPGRLFCYRHWCIIPRDLQQAILQAFGRRDATAYEMALTRARDHIDGCGDVLRRLA